MVKKKETKKPSAKEETLMKSEDKKKIFDDNDKLIITAKQQGENKTEEVKIPDTKKKSAKVKTISAEDAQKLKRAAWRNYYSEHKEKYKLWNKNWREKQKKKKSE